MRHIWPIITNVSSAIAIAALWGINESSALWVKITLTVFVVIVSIMTIIFGKKRKYKVTGFSVDDNNQVNKLLIKNAKSLQLDMLVSVYIFYEEEIILVAIGALAENEEDDDGVIQVNIEHRINDELLSKIAKNDKMKRRYFVRDTVRFSDVSDLMK